MRKAISFILGAGVLVCSFGIAACKEPSGGRSSYRIMGEYDQGTHTLNAEMTADIVNTSKVPLGELKFQLWANAYREDAKYKPVSGLFENAAYYGGESYGKTEIKGVKGAESFSVCGEDENILALKLASPLGCGKKASVTLSFSVSLPDVNHRLGVTQHTVNLANFYPVLCHLNDEGFHEYVYSYNGDPFVSAVADYDVTLTIPENYVIASGFLAEELADEDPTDGKKAYHVRAEGVRDMAFVLGDSLKCATEKVGDREVAYYYYDDAEFEKTAKTAAESLAFFSETFGNYEYPRYAVCQTGFVYGGMEFPAFAMISDSLRGDNKTEAVVHETAHQWWYSMVGSNQFENGWQDEGLAEYSTALFFEAHPEHGVMYSDFVAASERSYRTFFSVYSQVKGSADTSMNRPLVAYSGEYEYRNIVYDKGVILFDRVRETMGKRKFESALKNYFKEYSGKIASPEQLVACFARAQINIDELFDSFIEGKVVI